MQVLYQGKLKYGYFTSLGDTVGTMYLSVDIVERIGFGKTGMYACPTRNRVSK